MIDELLILLGVALGINVAMFAVAYRHQTDTLTDISYAMTFIILAVYGLLSNEISFMKIIGTVMVCVWATRLGGFLLYRIRKAGKDSRFDDIRNNFSKFLQFWVLQGLSVWVILIPMLLLFMQPSAPLGVMAIAGIFIWACGLVVEVIADMQKYRFARSPANKGKWIDQGIWKYSRHPNYFGEIVVWVGAYLFAISSLSILQGALAVVSPLFITSLLLFVSGIPKLETGADERWGANRDYQEYKRRTSLLLLSPKKPSK